MWRLRTALAERPGSIRAICCHMTPNLRACMCMPCHVHGMRICTCMHVHVRAVCVQCACGVRAVCVRCACGVRTCARRR